MVTVPTVPADAELVRARACAAAVPDPEIPVLTIDDLGILRAVEHDGTRIVVTLTPTYTGCPATEAIADDVRAALAAGGFPDAAVRTTLSPPWTTDWISEDGRRKLREYGIAPPGRAAAAAVLRFVPRGARTDAVGGAAVGGAARAATAAEPIACPRCGTQDVERLSEHGSTPCKALYRCVACREPFDYFKPY